MPRHLSASDFGSAIHGCLIRNGQARLVALEGEQPDNCQEKCRVSFNFDDRPYLFGRLRLPDYSLTAKKKKITKAG